MPEDTTQDSNSSGWRARLPRIFTDGGTDPDQSLPAKEGSMETNSNENADDLQNRLLGMQEEMLRMSQLVESINERESSQEKVFNTLHSELREYKNDFIYEHLKPIVRPLLFLYDSLEQFEAEVAECEKHDVNILKGKDAGERRQALSPKLVRENTKYFKDQLVEALRICEVTPMETPRGQFNPKQHKVIDVVPVKGDQDGTIQRVIRSGWFINQQVLRSAEVIIGKKISK